MAWDYAELSKMAKEAGGPEKLLDSIEEEAKSIGRMEGQSSMLPAVGIAALGASLLTAGIIKLVNHFRSKKAMSQANMAAARAELIQGIKQYDATHENCSQEGKE